MSPLSGEKSIDRLKFPQTGRESRSAWGDGMVGMTKSLRISSGKNNIYRRKIISLRQERFASRISGVFDPCHGSSLIEVPPFTGCEGLIRGFNPCQKVPVLCRSGMSGYVGMSPNLSVPKSVFAKRLVIVQAYWAITSLRYITYMYEDRTRC